MPKSKRLSDEDDAKAFNHFISSPLRVLVGECVRDVPMPEGNLDVLLSMADYVEDLRIDYPIRYKGKVFLERALPGATAKSAVVVAMALTDDLEPTYTSCFVIDEKDWLRKVRCKLADIKEQFHWNREVLRDNLNASCSNFLRDLAEENNVINRTGLFNSVVMRAIQDRSVETSLEEVAQNGFMLPLFFVFTHGERLCVACLPVLHASNVPENMHGLAVFNLDK